MEGFNLSPGITPAITDATLLLYVLIPFLGYLIADRRGLLVGFVVVSGTVAAVKLVTDWSDLWDVVVSLAALIAPVLWALVELRGVPRGAPLRTLLALLGAGAVVVGLIKAHGDFYDPFDLFLATSAILGGLGVLVRLARGFAKIAGRPPEPAGA